MSNPFAAVAITKHGVEMVRNLGASFPGTDVYYMSKFERGDEQERGIQLFEGSVKLILPDLFKQYNGIILFISLGAVVRMIAPILVDKKVDPAVVVIDDRGEHVISVLSGHLGGANELTRHVAAVLGARAVITTASDVQGTIPVDMFGRELGWVVDSFDKATPVSAAVVNEEPVALIQETGERNWWRYDKPVPGHIKVYASTAEALQEPFNAALVVSDRLLEPEEEEQLLSNGVLYRPKSLVLGIGCNRGTALEELEAGVLDTLQELRLSVKSVRNIATIDLKKDEEGLLALCAKYGWELVTYTPSELNTVQLPNPSETVFKYTGAYGVSEPSALLSSGADHWLLEKKKSGNMTLSVARVSYD
ncbi:MULTISPECIES: cobalt-precorrin 5A hydrolase [Paenibacillus]|uniref:Cobalamin biosynthesis protein n=1 Tax=Paenibacillus peoriae TaxID=59893 RepID=A0A7H0Y825_9BACL|nr:MULTISPECIES: cobalamin biosynthesis protein [Paenibacillus]KAF6634730.1 cobalamin biosynthesis protein [Paenibacillus sp. EKM208P]QNR67233.1 cobalamin biosynthesis protein [Paenibacillus peoriae]QYK64504.1 Cobalt-precorrin-5A hydrolase [Paenibacillus sp. S25]WCM61040.1 cobalamin biosynthesis protein [Paenibacillus polymyxa]WGV32989.1 cobalamin biosynthesis protein [Paenibacillus polymyxa]